MSDEKAMVLQPTVSAALRGEVRRGVQSGAARRIAGRSSRG